MKCPNWGKILAAAALCAALCACSKPQDVLPDHIATPEASATVALTAAVVQATATHAPTDTTVPTILPQTADAGRSYVDDTLFIGDSNTVRYTMYADDTGTAFSTLKNNIGVVSMGAGSITTLKCEKFKGTAPCTPFRMPLPSCSPNALSLVSAPTTLGAAPRMPPNSSHSTGRGWPPSPKRGPMRILSSAPFPAGPAAGQHQPDHDPGRCVQRRPCDDVRGGRLQIFEHRRSTAG